MVRAIVTPRARTDEETGASIPVKPPTYKAHLAATLEWLRGIASLPPGLFGGDFAVLFVDVRALQRQKMRKFVLRDIQRGLGEDARRFVPVVAENSLTRHYAAAATWNAEHRCGVALRVVQDRRRVQYLPGLPDLLATALAVKCGVESVDLIVDLGHVEPNEIAHLEATLPDRLRDYCTVPWRTVTLVAGGFPKSISKLKYTTTPIPRIDFILWRRIADSLARTGSRIPFFGDYGMLYPTAGGGFAPEVPPNIRLTCDLTWEVFRRARPSDVREMCRSILKMYRDKLDPRNWGVGWIADRAKGVKVRRNGKEQTVNGNAMIWLKVALSYHLSFVARQMKGSS